MGRVLKLDGLRCGLMVSDGPAFQLTKSVGVSCWLNLKAMPGFASQIIFRGDDRTGVDPFTLVIHPDGRIYFSVQNERDEGIFVSSPVALNQWTHITACLDDSRDLIRIWVDGQLIDALHTKIRPFAVLDQSSAPGIGIGNVQNDLGPHNQPFNGFLADVRIYNCPISPKSVGFQPNGWKGQPGWMRENEG